MEKEIIKKILGQEGGQDLAVLKKGGLLKNFYLAGGTGAALILGHRLSKDLDFFTPKPFNENLFLKKISRLGKFNLEKKRCGDNNRLF